MELETASKDIGKNAKQLRVVFMGTPDFAVGVLRTILEKELNVVGVITAPDKPAGRGRKLRSPAVKEFALEQGLKVLQPPKLKDPDFLKELKELQADLQVVVAFRMLPEAVWSMPRHGTFNLHASLLPQYRGAAPINWAIMNGETETGVTTFFIDDKIDTGAIIIKEMVPITAEETAGSLHDKLMLVGSELVVKTIDLIAEGRAEPKEQPKTDTMKAAPKLKSENTRIDWSRSARQLDLFIRGLNPYPSAWTQLHNNGENIKVKIYKVQVEMVESDREPGTIIRTGKDLKVACGEGQLFVEEIQLAGKRKMSVSDLLNGFQFEDGAKFF